jgi:hypothetical protein
MKAKVKRARPRSTAKRVIDFAVDIIALSKDSKWFQFLR